MNYELFISYSRRDNLPQKHDDAKGWVTALRDAILADHRRFSTEPLSIFFDTEAIQSMEDWRHRILEALRHSRILLVCLSPDYFRSEYCRMEWEEYLKRQVHALMGHDSIAPVYFVEAPGSNEEGNAAAFVKWVADIRPWLEGVMRPNFTDLRPWFPLGVEALREAVVREKLAALGTSLWERIQRARHATGVPGNLRRLNPHFIGRHTELRQLHENLALGAVGVVTAVHGLGGQGKTELATAYAHGWADSYPTGLWVLGAEGKKEILPLLSELCVELEIPFTSGPDETAAARGRRVLAELKRRALEAAQRDPDKGAACLVILDNVSEPALLAEPQLAHIPREDWLRVVVTTREGPEKFPASRQKSLAFIAVDALREDEAARLIEDHQPNGQWPAACAVADAAAAREIARELAGFTLAIESVAIYLGLHPDIRPADYLARLLAEGLPSVDTLPAGADVAAQMQHREKQLRLVLDQTLARFTPSERTTLDYATLLPPDNIPWPWLRLLVEEEHPDALAARPGYPDPWLALRRRLEGLRLLTPGDHPEIARLHRLVLALVFKMPHDAAWSSFIKLLDNECFEFTQQCLKRDAQWKLAPLVATVNVWAARLGEGAFGLLGGKLALPLHRLGYIHEAAAFSTQAVKLIMAQPVNEATKVSVGILTHHASIARDFRQYGVARTVLEHAVNLASRIPKLEKSIHAQCLATLAVIEQDCGEFEKANAHYSQALQILSPPSRENEHKYAEILCSLGSLANDTGEPAKACELLKAGISHLERIESPDAGILAANYANLGLAERDLGNTNEALRLLEKALEIESEIYQTGHFMLGCRHGNIASVRMDREEWGEAKRHLEKVIPIAIDVYGEGHEVVAWRFADLAWCEHGLGNLSQAEAHITKAIAMAEAIKGFSPETLAQYYATKSVIRKEMGEPKQSADLMQRARALMASER